jgi:class 3 adenylate cyclase/tetratricopeptide (TPR) repeat protein
VVIDAAAFYACLVTICASCAHENADGAKFCQECGSELSVAAQERRKLATLLFCDVSGSTAMGERLDSEAVRELMFRYFHQMRSAIEGHGGTVEKFVGDAVLAVFGVPLVHEDDALRATRAALEMRRRLEDLNEELERRFGAKLHLRIGINTGEVVSGDASSRDTFVTGDAVNVAARLEQAAQPGEILLGELSAALSRAEVEALAPIAAKGKSEPVPAFRLLAAPPPAARAERPLVGRERELEQLQTLLEQAVSESRCLLASVVGEPGVGKTRLMSELCSRLGSRARILGGRCRSYGEGITYWPLAEIVRQAASIRDEDSREQARAKLEQLCDARAARAVSAFVGLGGEVTLEEAPWAFATLLSSVAQEQPLLLVVEDVHWAEEALLELLEDVAGRIRQPVLLLATARPEREWHAELRLRPLASDEIARLLASSGIATEARAEVVRRSGGNPLFAEELAAYLRECPDAGEIPPTLSALLSARLDLLSEAERACAERGAVEGEFFHRGAVETLSPDGDVQSLLERLVERELIRSAPALFVGEAAFRFKHALVRDAAYSGISKRRRAELHERFADWLADKAGDRFEELEEIVGYHLEQACRYRRELGLASEELAERAGSHLATAGRRALWRLNYPVAAGLLGRAAEMSRPLRLDVHLELDLARSHVQSPAEAAAIAAAASERARIAGDQTGEALAQLFAVNIHLFDGGAGTDDLDSCVRVVIPMLEQAGDHVGLVDAYNALISIARVRGQYEAWARAAEQAIHHTRLAGRPASILFGLGLALAHGPRRADEAILTFDAVAGETPPPSSLLDRAVLAAMLGRFDEAWPLAREASARLEEMGADPVLNEASLAEIAMLAGDYEAAASRLRRLCGHAEERYARSALSTFAVLLGRVLCELGRFDEAEPLAKIGRQERDEEDLEVQALWRQVQARVLAYRGESESAEALAREAIAIVEQTDGLNIAGDAYCDLADVLTAAGRTDEAAEALGQALNRYERKKNLAMVAQVKPKLEALRTGVQ